MRRTNIVLDEELVDKVMEITQAKSKREAIHIALEQLVQKTSLANALSSLRGKLSWQGSLKKMRRHRL